MWKVLSSRLKQGFRTVPFPSKPPVLPERFRGVPVINSALCGHGCHACVQSCPTGAIQVDTHGFHMDLGKCLFCVDCRGECPKGAIHFSKDYCLAARNKKDLILQPGKALPFIKPLDKNLRKILGRSLRLRQVSAGGCNGCESDVNVLNTVVFDLGRFGIQFVASPRHADGLLITGPVTENMSLALKKTYDAIPSPKIVIAVGACAISGGPYVNHSQVRQGADRIVPVDLYVPGCPPHPITILDGILKLLGKTKRQD